MNQVQLNQRVRALKSKLVTMVMALATEAEVICEDQSVSICLKTACQAGDEDTMIRGLKKAAVHFCMSDSWRTFRHAVCVLEAFDDMRHASSMSAFLKSLSYGERHALA